MSDRPSTRRTPAEAEAVPDAARGEFATLIRRYRHRAQLTQEELAERAGISARSISNLERGRIRCPRLDTARLLARALDLSGAEREDFVAWARHPSQPEPDLPATVLRGGGRPSAEDRAPFVPWPAGERFGLPPDHLCLAPIRLLGPVRITPGPQVGRDTGPETDTLDGWGRAVLACLALHVTALVPADQIVDEVWGDRPPSSARAVVRDHVASIRDALRRCDTDLTVEVTGPTGDGFRLVGRREQVDWYLFEDLAGQGRSLARSGDHRMAGTLLATALDLWRGPALADLPRTPLGSLFRPVMEASRHATLGDRIDVDSYRPGRARAPSRDVPQHPLTTPVPERGGAEPGRLPPPTPLRWTGRFVGRDRELAELDQLVHSCRLVTLVGPPGVGKSRLAWEMKDRIGDPRNGNAWLVDLGDVADPEQVSQAVVQALGSVGSPHRDPAELLKSHLLGREALLVLDNCEGLAECCADLVVDLLASRPLLRVLVTSREPLVIPWETRYRVDPLPVPEDRCSTAAEIATFASVQLFCDRARSIRPFFDLSEDIAPTVAAICRAVDGLPLALELASARVGMLSGPELAERLHDQLTLLAHPPGRASDRHGSLRTAMADSCASLGDTETDLFARLSVFPGAFTLAGAESIATESIPPVLDQVQLLVDKSLVTADVTRDPTRYRMLEPIRQYAASLLDAGAAAEARRLRARYLLDLARTAVEERHGPSRARWMRRLDTERTSVDATLRVAVAEGDHDTALELSALLWWWWSNTPREGLAWYRRILAEAGTPAPDPAHDGTSRTTAPPDVAPRNRLGALLAASVIASYTSPHEAMGYAERAHREATELGETLGRVRALQHISDNAFEIGDLDRARDAGDAALALAAELGGYALARCELTVAYTRFATLDLAQAADHARRAVACFAGIEDEVGEIDATLCLAEIAVLTGNGAETVPVLENALSVYRRVDSQENVAQTAVLLATARAGESDRARCVDLVREACDIHATIRHPWNIANDLDHLAGIAARWDNHALSVTLLTAADLVRARAGLRPTPQNRAVRAPAEDACSAVLGANLQRIAGLGGTSTDLNTALSFARSLT